MSSDSNNNKIIANLSLFFEGDVKSRMDSAKERAKEVFEGTSGDLDDHALQMAFILSQHYNIPLFSEYFQERTFDELVFELELIQLLKKPTKPKMEEIVKDDENKEELSGMFDDWFQESVDKHKQKTASQSTSANEENPPKESEEQPVKWVDVNKDISDNDAMKMAEEHFFKTGEFLPNTENDHKEEGEDSNDK